MTDDGDDRKQEVETLKHQPLCPKTGKPKPEAPKALRP